MTPRRWTILVVPHDSDSPRQFELGERRVRLLAGIVGTAALLVLLALGVLFSPWATPGARLAARQATQLRQEVARLDGALRQLGDSMGVLATREAEFRNIAGVTTLDSARAQHDLASAVGTNRASLATRPRPFDRFFGNRSARPDADALIRRAGELSNAFAEVSDSMSANIERLRTTPSIMPTTGWLVSNFSGSRLHPILNERRPHLGIDVSAPSGAPIVAPAAGVVLKVAVEGGYGNTLEIDHGNGIRTRYAHCSRILVREGQRVERGQNIARVGSTGLTAGPHLHYEIFVDGKPVNPLTYVLPTDTPQ